MMSVEPNYRAQKLKSAKSFTRAVVRVGNRVTEKLIL